MAPAISGNSVLLTTLAVRNAAASRFGTVRYSGLAFNFTLMTGTFCGV